MTKSEIARLISRFATDDKQLDPWAWDGFISVAADDPEIEEIRQAVIRIEIDYPPEKRGWCSQLGIEKLKQLAAELK